MINLYDIITDYYQTWSGKLIEIGKLMRNCQNTFLEQHEIIYDYQFGFRYNNSTDHALIALTQGIINVLYNNNFVCGVS